MMTPPAFDPPTVVGGLPTAKYAPDKLGINMENSSFAVPSAVAAKSLPIVIDPPVILIHSGCGNREISKMSDPRGTLAMTDPDCYEVSYTINPWMDPAAWKRDGAEARARARRQWQGLADRLAELGMTIEVIPAAPGLPDLVFPANAAIVLDRRALLAAFRHPERRGEEACFHRFFEGLRARGRLDTVMAMPAGIFQEGAGDCLWDDFRQMFWAGWGPRSSSASLPVIERFFHRPVTGLELVTERFYHLDTCFSVLSGGEVLYFPGALSPAGCDEIARRVAPDQRIEASAEEAATFGLNAVNIGRDLVMAAAPPRLKAILTERGYRCLPVDLSSFILSGGASFCMTLRLDRTSHATTTP